MQVHDGLHPIWPCHLQIARFDFSYGSTVSLSNNRCVFNVILQPLAITQGTTASLLTRLCFGRRTCTSRHSRTWHRPSTTQGCHAP
jgi:hypothetical protein